jgi:hypothetical protein
MFAGILRSSSSPGQASLCEGLAADPAHGRIPKHHDWCSTARQELADCDRRHERHRMCCLAAAHKARAAARQHISAHARSLIGLSSFSGFGGIGSSGHAANGKLRKPWHALSSIAVTRTL